MRRDETIKLMNDILQEQCRLNQLDLIEAYGASQYEAGAASMRERAATYADRHWTVRVAEAMPEVSSNFAVHSTDCPQTSLIPLAEELRSLPLREKD